MNTVVVGLDDGTRNYLGRREQAPDRTNDPLAKAISRKWERMKAVRRKTEDLRWEACAFVNHRCAEFVFDTLFLNRRGCGQKVGQEWREEGVFKRTEKGSG
jgi:hypothetical protein